MSDFHSRLGDRIQQIDKKIAQIDAIRPVDDKHRVELAQARQQLATRWGQAEADKTALDNQAREYWKNDSIQKKLIIEAQQTQKEQDYQLARHEQLKQYYGNKYPGSYDPKTNTIDASKWSMNDYQNYERSRKARNDALAANQKKQRELQEVTSRKQEALTKYSDTKAKAENRFAGNSDITDPCAPCLNERREKLDRISAVFPGQQSYGNCGVQSSNQLIELVSCKRTDEKKLLDKSLKNGNASLYLKGDPNPADPSDPAAAKVLADIKPVRDINDPVNNGSIGSHRQRRPNTKNDKHNETIIDTGLTGGTNPNTRKKIIASEGVDSDTVEPEVDTIEQNLKDNKVMIFATDVSKLGPAEDANGNEIDGWVYTADVKDAKGNIIHKKGDGKQSGGHAITVADGKFDKNGKLTHVLVSDTGLGKMYYMKIKDFKDSLRPGKKMNVSKEPMKMSCP